MAFINLTKATGAGAGWSHQQEGGGFLGVAFASVGTAPFFADGVNLPLLDNFLHGGNVASFADGTAQPVWHLGNIIAALTRRRRGAIAGGTGVGLSGCHGVVKQNSAEFKRFNSEDSEEWTNMG